MQILLAILLGGLFGFALYIAGASRPKNILSMLRLKDLTLMKVIVFAIGFAGVLLSITIMTGIFNVSHLSIKATNFGVVIGGIIFGLGFGLAGTCPGTCVAALGTDGIKRGIVAVIGGLVGAFAFSMTYGFWKNTGLFKIMDLGRLTLFHLTDKYPSVFNMGAAGLLIVGIILMGVAYILPLNTDNK